MNAIEMNSGGLKCDAEGCDYRKTECDEHQWGDWRHTGWGRSAQSNGPGPVDIDIFVRHCKNCPAVESEDRQRDLSSRDGGKR